MNLFKPKIAAHLSVGAQGEKIAQSYLKKCGYQIIAVNFKNETGRRVGEIDIIAKDGEEIVFIEVKTRQQNSQHTILPEENITNSKLYKLNKIASLYISKNNLWDNSYRFDAVSVLLSDSGEMVDLKHLKHIFT